MISMGLTRLEAQAGMQSTDEALRVADSAIKLGMIPPEEREQFASASRGCEAMLAERKEGGP